MQRLIFNYKFSFFRNKGHQQKKKHTFYYTQKQKGGV